jgi:hypothetical protein
MMFNPFLPANKKAPEGAWQTVDSAHLSGIA